MIRFALPVVCFSLLAFPLAKNGQRSQKAYGLDYVLFKGQPAPSKDLFDTLSRQARWDDESGDLNPTGFHMRFVKIDEQTGADGRITDRYRVYVDGAPENKIFAFGSWPINKPLAFDSHDIYVNGQGLLLLHKPKPEQELSLSEPEDELVVVANTGTAEPVRYIFTRRDGQLLISATLVPHPIKSEEQGCQLEVRIAAPDASSVLLVIDGFPAKEKIPLVLESEDLSLSETMITNEDGHAVIAAFPFIPGKTQGTLRASAEGPGCLPEVRLPWSSAAQAPASTSPKKKP
ncbi:MAG TPA: hypothetical protein VGF01_10170 [Terracidiphilus sp.]|jgi:hypothetical protein